MACREWSRGGLCGRCSGRHRVGGVRRLSNGLLVWSGFEHAGAPRELVHRLKFEGLSAAATWLARRMAPLVRQRDGVLVPIPRTRSRRIKYGVDTAHILARILGEMTGRPVERVLRAPFWGPSHTGQNTARRRSPAFSGTGGTRMILLIDDVVTTGSTLVAASDRLGVLVVGAVTATCSQK